MKTKTISGDVPDDSEVVGVNVWHGDGTCTDIEWRILPEPQPVALRPTVPEGLIQALGYQRQIDEEGVECGVNRQAVDEAIEILKKIVAYEVPLPSSTESRPQGDEQTAKQKYDEYMADDKEPDAIERLRFFCAQAMNGQDWLDVEPFFNDVIAATTAAPQGDGQEEIERLQQRIRELEYTINDYEHQIEGFTSCYGPLATAAHGVPDGWKVSIHVDEETAEQYAAITDPKGKLTLFSEQDDDGFRCRVVYRFIRDMLNAAPSARQEKSDG
jgi:hypothetical protein